MKLARNLLLLAGAACAASVAYAAEGHVYSSDAQAAQACGADTVVWVDLDRGRFYEKGQAEYGKGSNGGYGCLKEIHAKYRPGRTQ